MSRKQQPDSRFAAGVPGPAPVTRREWLIVAACALVMGAVVLAPIIQGYLLAPPQWHFVGFVGGFNNDYSGYLAWMRQAQDGHLLFRDLYTSEPHGRVVFQPLFYLMGSAARITGASLMTVWYVTDVLGCALMIVAIYRFCAQFTDNIATRGLGLVLSLTAAGLGWMTGPARPPFSEHPIDMWMVEANQFQAMVTSFFTLPIALGLMLLSMVYGLRFMQTGRWRQAVAAGLLALVLAAVHPYDIITLFAVLAVWTLLWPLAARPKLDSRTWLRRAAGMWLVPAIASPYIVYGLMVTRSDPVLSQLKWAMDVPGLWPHLLGYGLPLLLAVFALLLPAVWKHNRLVLLLAAWLLTAVVLVNLPVAFERKLIWGVHVPMCLLAAMGALAAWRRLAAAAADRTTRIAAGVLAAATLVGACGVGSYVLYRGLFARNEQIFFGDYMPEPYMQSLGWLAQHHRPGEVVLAGPALTALVPGYTGDTVFYGHWAQTLDPERKLDFLKALVGPPGGLAPAAIRRILSRNRVRYIVLDAMGMGWRNGIPGHLPRMTLSPATKVVYRNPLVVILEVLGYKPQSETQLWASGNWEGPSNGMAQPWQAQPRQVPAREP